MFETVESAADTVQRVVPSGAGPPDRPLLAPVRPDLVWVAGPDAVRFLNDLVSQEIASLPPGVVTRSLFLTPRGRIDHIMWVLRGEEEVGLMVDQGRGEALVAALIRYRIRVRADIEPSPAEVWLVVGRYRFEPGRWVGDRSGLVADVSWPQTVRALVVGDRPDLPVMDPDGYHRLRIENGEPVVGVDVDDSTIPQETGLVPVSVAFDKGCFLGQELVARLDSRGGRVNRHLRVLRFEGPAPEPGAVLVQSGEEVGVVSSAAGGVALAMVHRRIEPGAVVEVGGVTAKVGAVAASSRT